MKPHRRYCDLVLVPFVLGALSCHGDDAIALDETTTTTTSAGPEETADEVEAGAEAEAEAGEEAGEGADVTGGPGDPEACEAIEPVACPLDEPPNGPFEMVHVIEADLMDPIEDICPCRDDEMDLALDLYAPEGWPVDPASAPLFLFTHGNGQSSDLYDHLFESMVELGFVVVSVEFGAFATPAQRADSLACAAEWAKRTYDEALRCELVLAGHSNGGHGVVILNSQIEQEPYASIFRPFDLRSIVLLAPEQDTTPEVVPNALLVPALIFGGAADEQVIGDALTIYDLRPPDTNSSPESDPSRYSIWLDGVDHNDFGGQGAPSDIAEAALTGYVPPFVTSTGFLASGATLWSYITGETWPAGVADDDLWSALPEYTKSRSGVCSSFANQGTCETSPGCAWISSACTTDCPTFGTALSCDAQAGCAWSSGASACIDAPRVRTSFTAPPGQRYPLQLFEGDYLADMTFDPGNLDATVDAAPDLLQGLTLNVTPGHVSDVMIVQWGGTGQEELGPDGEVYIQFPSGTEDLGGLSYLGLRAGNLLELGSPTDCNSEVAGLEAIAFDVMLGRGGAGVGEYSEPVSTGLLVPQYHEVHANMCHPAQAMHTVRFSMARFCDFGIDEVDQVVLSFPETEVPSRVMVDSIEFTDATHDHVEGGYCGTEGGQWACEVDELVVTETSCSGEPTPTCDSGDIESDSLLPPLVDVGGGYTGWLVHTRPGVVRDRYDPTQDELDLVLERCVAACELEYASDPNVAANCTANDAFLMPALLSTDGHGAYYRIPEAQTDGSGLFTAQALACNLRTDCSEAFDESIAATRLVRPTEAAQGLGRGEEWVVTLEGSLKAYSSFAPLEYADADLVGTAGYSRCAAGNADGPCPFYLGSLEVDLAESLVLALECDEQPITHELEALTVRLAQPAFGISEEDTNWKAFPAGGLVLEVEGIVDEMPFEFRAPTEEPVFFQASDGWLQTQLAGGFAVDFEIPCNGEMADVLLWFDLDAVAAPESPPYVVIDVPTSVSCPSNVDLEASPADPDGDVESVRWLVDGVLIDASTTTIPFTTPHTLTAIVRDERGATGTTVKEVDCQ